MKKLIGLVIALVIVLAAISTGTAYYIGKRFETESNRVIQLTNQKLAARAKNQPIPLLKHLHVSIENYHRGLFTSQFQTKFTDTTATEKTPLLVVNFTLHHGPFSFTEIARLNFLPTAVLQATPSMDQGSISQQIAKFSQGKIYYTSTSHIHYGLSDKIITEIKIPPLNYQDNDFIADFAGANIRSVGSTKAFLSESYQILSGEFSLQAGKLTLRNDNKSESVEIGSISGDSKTESGKDLATHKVNLTVKDVKYGDHVLGGGGITLQINNIDKKSLLEYVPSFERLAQSATENPELENDQAFIERMNKFLLAMTKTQPELIIDTLNWHNDAGAMTYKLKLVFNDASKLSSAELQNPPVAFKAIVKSIDSQAELSKPALIKLLAQSTSIANHQPYEQEQKSAIQSVGIFSAIGEQLNFLKTDKDSITSKITYQNDMINLNGKEMTLEQYMSGLSR